MKTQTAFRIIFVSLLLVIPFSIWLAPSVTAWVFAGIFFLAPLWLPVLLFIILVPLWITFVRSQYVFNVPYVVLELKPGELTPKSARAMELVFYSLHHRTTISRAREILFGEMRLPWHFEIAVTEGTVRFYMRIPKSHRQAVELRLRAEYRDIDLDEVRDYAREIAFDPITMNLEAREYTLEKPDPYPLKTYEAHENEKRPHNPFTEFLEEIVSVGENEHLFISFSIRPHQRTRKYIWQRAEDTLHRDAQEEIAKIIGVGGDLREVSEAKKQLIASMEQALKKPSFDCAVRALYFAPRDSFKVENAQKLDTLFNRFSDPILNNFKAHNPRAHVGWPLSDIFLALPWLNELYLLNLYRRRSFFMPPYYGDEFVLNTAELATVYHLPHITRASPLARSSGKRLEPPDNLPVIS